MAIEIVELNLVGGDWNMNVMTSIIYGNVIIQLTNSIIFQRGRRKTTNQITFLCSDVPLKWLCGWFLIHMANAGHHLERQQGSHGVGELGFG